MNCCTSSKLWSAGLLIATSCGFIVPSYAGFGDASPTPDNATKAPTGTAVVTSDASRKGFGSAVPNEGRGIPEIAVVEESSTTVPALWDKLRSGQMDPETAWNAKEINTTDILGILNYRECSDLKYRDLALKLVAVLDKYDTESISDPKKQDLRARSLIVIYLAKKKDPRTVTYYEYIISLIKRPSSALEFSIFYLSNYYKSIGNLKLAAETRLRYKDYSTAPAGLACSYLEAADFYKRMGDKKKADELYSQVPKHGYGWATGIFLIVRAGELFAHKKYEEGRKVLTSPVLGDYSDQVKVLTTLLLANSYYAEHKLKEAEFFYNETIKSYQLLANPLKKEGLEEAVGSAGDMVKRIEQWKKAPFICSSTEAVILISKGKSKDFPGKQPLIIQSLKSIPLTVQCDNRNIKSRIVELNRESDTDASKEVIIEVVSGTAAEDFHATLTISSPSYPNYKVDVPVFVEFRE